MTSGVGNDHSSVFWNNAFQPEERGFLSLLFEVYPGLLDGDTKTPPTVREVARSILRHWKSPTSEAQAFKEYIARKEFWAANALCALHGGNSAQFGTSMDVEERLTQARRHFIFRMAQLNEILGELRKVEFQPQDLESQLEEVWRLLNTGRVGAAESLASQLEETARGRTSNFISQLKGDLRQLESRFEELVNDFERQNARVVLNRIGRYLDEGELGLAREATRRAIEGDLPAPRPDVEMMREPAPFPAIRLTDVLKILDPAEPDPQRHYPLQDWNQFVVNWDIEELRRQERSGQGAERTGIVSVLQALMRLKERTLPTADLWETFIREFLRALGVLPSMAPRLRSIGGGTVYWGNCDPSISCYGTFLNSKRLPQGLMMVCWDPSALPLGALQSSLRERERVGAIFTPDRVLATQVRKDFNRAFRRLALVDEEAILRILSCGSSAERLDRFVREVATQADPEAINPFTSFGVVQEQGNMFFGRSRELEVLMSPNAPVILFGGRMLGKSSLLKELAARFEEQDVANFAVFHTIGDATAPREVVRHVLSKLQDRIRSVLPEDKRRSINPNKPNTFAAQLDSLITSNPGTQILILLDEADTFALYSAGPRSQDPSQWERNIGWDIRQLLTDYSQVRFIMVGFSGIQRAANAKAGPYLNLRGSEAVVDLPVLAEHEAAHLIIRSLNLLGLTFERRSLVDRIIDYTGRHPSLLQHFCRMLFMRIRQRAQEPPFLVTAADVDGVFASPDFRKELIRAIELNVDGDDKAKVLMRIILYLTVYRLFASELGRTRTLEIRNIRPLLAEMLGHLPSSEVLGTDEIERAMDSLKNLGVLGRSNTGYFLANSYFAYAVHEQRGIEFIERELSNAWNYLISPSASRARNVVTVAESSRPTLSPLSVTDEERWNAVTNKPAVLLGPPRMGKSTAIQWLVKGSPTQSFKCRDLNQAKDILALLGTEIGAKNQGDILPKVVDWAIQTGTRDHPALLVLEDADNVSGLLGGNGLLTRLGHRCRQSEGRLRVIVSGGPKLAQDWVRGSAGTEDDVMQLTVKRFSGSADRGMWFRAHGLVAPPDLQEAIWREANGDPRLLDGLLRLVPPGDERHVTEKHLEQFRRGLRLPLESSFMESAIDTVREHDSSLIASWAICEAWGAHVGSSEIDDEWIQLLVMELEGSTNLFPSWAKAITNGWGRHDWTIKIRALQLLDELPAAQSQGTYASASEGDPWLNLACRILEGR